AAAAPAGDLPAVRIHAHRSPSSALDAAHHAEADARAGHVRIHPRTPGRAGLRRRTGPGTATHHPRPATGVVPGRTVGRGAPVAGMPAVGDPLGNIAGQVVKTPCIGPEAPGRGHAPVAVAIAGK